MSDVYVSWGGLCCLFFWVAACFAVGYSAVIIARCCRRANAVVGYKEESFRKFIVFVHETSIIIDVHDQTNVVRNGEMF